MTWTTEPPTEPGFYWIHIKGANEPFVAEMLPERERDTVDYVFCTSDEGWELDELSRWAGPIPLPSITGTPKNSPREES